MHKKAYIKNVIRTTLAEAYVKQASADLGFFERKNMLLAGVNPRDYVRRKNTKVKMKDSLNDNLGTIISFSGGTLATGALYPNWTGINALGDIISNSAKLKKIKNLARFTTPAAMALGAGAVVGGTLVSGKAMRSKIKYLYRKKNLFERILSKER